MLLCSFLHLIQPMAVLTAFCQLDFNLDIPGKKEPLTEELPPSHWPVGMSVGHSLWIAVGGPSPR